MLISTAAGIFATLGLFWLMDWASTCNACVTPQDGGFGTTLLFVALILVFAGLVPAYAKRRRATVRIES